MPHDPFLHVLYFDCRHLQGAMVVCVLERTEHNQPLDHGLLVQMRAFICGIDAPLDVPLLWLHANMHHLDHFLYVVVHLS